MSGLASERVAEQLVHALGHFAGGLVGEGDGQDGVGRDAFLADQPGDAAGDDAGLARAGAGQDEQRALGGLDGGALFGIQIGEQRLQGGVQAGRVLSLVYRLPAGYNRCEIGCHLSQSGEVNGNKVQQQKKIRNPQEIFLDKEIPFTQEVPVEPEIGFEKELFRLEEIDPQILALGAQERQGTRCAR